MNYLYRSIFILSIILTFVSCKNETKKNPTNTLIEETIVAVDTIPKTRPLTVDDRNEDNAILTNMMLTIEAKTFVSLMVSAGLTDRLFTESDPFTVFAPSYIAFDKIPKEKMKFYLDFKNKKNLVTLINSHIIDGFMDSKTLIKSINDNGGSYSFKTISGTILIASLSGNEIILKDGFGHVATLEESDINGINGVFHLIDSVLQIN